MNENDRILPDTNLKALTQQIKADDSFQVGTRGKLAIILLLNINVI